MSWHSGSRWCLAGSVIVVVAANMTMHHENAYATQFIDEPVQACVIARDNELTPAIRAKYAQCLGWQEDANSPVCLGSYEPIAITPFNDPDEIQIKAHSASFYREKPSTLSGDVRVQHGLQIMNAQTAHVYRDSKTNQVNKIELLGNVRYLDPDTLMISRKVTMNPQDKSGETEDVLYRFNANKKQAMLPAWGRASLIRRYANNDFLLRKATYTTCAPQDKSWDIQAGSITIDDANATGVARHAKIRIREWPVLYLPYLSFPTNKERKSGFLMPIVGYSNVGGFDFGLPYYLNLAPNYDLTLTPHLFTERGVMLGGEYRFLSANSSGMIRGNLLPQDRAYRRFINDNEPYFPRLRDNSTDRWSLGILETTHFTPDLALHVNAQQVSDDYYLQDFSSNWAVITQRQLLRQIDLTYTSEHWTLMGMGQSYQTLHPVNETPIAPVYERLPQLMARGAYYDLPYNANLNILAQYDQFHWPKDPWAIAADNMPEGPRFHFNPVLSLPMVKPWGYLTPSVQLVENYYNVNNHWGISSTDYAYSIPYFSGNSALYIDPNSIYNPNFNSQYNVTIPRYSLDGGLFFERDLSWAGHALTQTLEPHLFYLRVPYHNQTPIPVYDSGLMIFNVDQLFRSNRFSGFDRIGDANQLAYALTTRWLSESSGVERASFSIGQIKYFSDRKVQLCQNLDGYCVDNPLVMGSLSSTSGTSPIASRAAYHFNSIWKATGDYVWDPATRETNNSNLNLHYQPAANKVVTAGYSYLVNGDITYVRGNESTNNSLHQAIVATALPLTQKWSALGAYSHNISKNYSMMSLLGVQYDSCCWAMRLLGGRTFKNLDAGYEPQYNNNVYLQIMLKGLGSVANSDPYNILNTYIPGYSDPFHR